MNSRRFRYARLKRGGEAANGLKSISQAIGSKDYLRVRVGLDVHQGEWRRAMCFARLSQPNNSFWRFILVSGMLLVADRTRPDRYAESVPPKVQ